MEKYHGFQQEIRDWVGSLGKHCTLLRTGDSLFDMLLIDMTGEARLILKLVDLSTWQRFFAEAKKELACKGLQNTLSDRQVIVWEDCWLRHQGIVKSRINAILGISERIPARLTQMRRLDKKNAAAFLNTNHLQGNVLSKTQYGLFLPEKYYRILSAASFQNAPQNEWLVAVATFSHARVFHRNEKPYRSFELIRFASALNTTVVGGLAKLIKSFSRDFHAGDIMTYADLEWSDGNSYSQLGFKVISDIPPVDFWLDTESLTRYSTTKRDMNLENKILVSNAGSRKFVLDLHDEPGN